MMGSSLPTPSSSSCSSSLSRDGDSSIDHHILREGNVSPVEMDHGSQNRPQLGESPSLASSQPRTLKRLKGKEKELANASKKRRPLQLLDLPVDILQEIIKEVRRTQPVLARGCADKFR